MLKRLKYSLRQIKLILIEALPFIIFLLGIVIAYYVPMKLNLSDPLPYSVSILEFIALLMFVNGLNKVQKYYTGKGFFRTILNWFYSLNRICDKPHEVTANIGGGLYMMSELSGDLSVNYNLSNPEHSIQERVDLIVKTILEMGKDFTNLKKSVSKNKAEFRESLADLRRQVNNKFNLLKEEQSKQVEMSRNIQFGGLHYELVGVLWLISALFIDLFT